MIHSTRRFRSLGVAGIAALASIAAAAGCAGRPQLATTGPTLFIRVEGRPDPAAPLMVWAVPPNGERLRLGLLTSATSDLLRFDRVDPQVTYRFVAERQGAVVVTSPPFMPGPVGAIAWNLSANTITPADTTASGVRAPTTR